MMDDVINNTGLSCMARFIILWILRNPSEAINPDAIAEVNRITVKMVKSLLAELAAAHYLVKPARVNNPGKAGQFTWTPYTLNPYYGQPSHGEPEDGKEANGDTSVPAEKPLPENPPMDTAANGISSTTEYVSAAGEEKTSLSLNAKESLVLSDTEKDRQTDSLTLPDLDKGATVVNSKPVEFEGEPNTEPEVKPIDTQDDGLGKAALAFLEKIGGLTTLLQDDLKDIVCDYGGYPTSLAIYKAADEVAKAQRGERTPILVPTWSYAKGILKKQKAEGDLPVESVSGEPVKKVDTFNPFDRDNEPLLEPEPELLPSSPEPILNQCWYNACMQLELQLGSSFDTWLRKAKFVSVEGNCYTIQAHSEIARDALQHRLYRNIRRVLSDVHGESVDIKFVIEGVSHADAETA